MTHVLCVLAILSASSAVQTASRNAEATEVFRCDFGEASDSNFDAWPDQWTRRRGPGYPAYIPIEIVNDPQPAAERNRCLQIRMDGGAAQVFAPAVAVTPNYSYSFEAQVRTSGLKHDLVSLCVTLYDAQDKLLETHESEAYRQADHWTLVRMGPFAPANDQARFAVLSVHVYPAGTADLSGTVWVDDLVFARLPKMSVQTNSEYNVYTDPRAVNITCHASGFRQPNPVFTFELFDLHGQIIASAQQIMSGSGESGRLRGRSTPPAEREEGIAGTVQWKPPIPGYGFYTVRVSSAGHSGLKVNLVVAPPLDRGRSGEFGWSLPEGERPIGLKALPSLLAQAGVHWVKFPVWFSASETKRAEELAAFAERLSTHDVQLVGVLDRPPQDLQQSFGALDRLAAASLFEDRAVWHPALDAVMTRLSLKVQWWQLGRDSDSSFSSYPDLNAKMREITDDLTSFGQQVQVGIPWRIIEDPPDVPRPAWAFLSYFDESPLTATELKTYLASEPVSRSKRFVVVQPLPRSQYDLHTRARDLVLRMVAAKISDAKGIFLPNPFDHEHGVMDENGSPNELLLPWRTTAVLTGGSEYLGSIRLPRRSENHILIRNNQAVMIVWNDRPVKEAIMLGNDVKLYDIWGRQSVPTTNTDGDFTRHEIPVGPMPTFVTGINPAIALWRMKFRFETPRVASEFGREHIVVFRFQNTFPHGVGGRLTLHTPNSWKTDGQSRQFKLAPNEERQESVRVVLGPDANAGHQPIRVDFELTADQTHHFSLYESLQVGLGDVVVELDTRLDELGNLVVEQHLINNTEKPVSFNCMLFAPERRREKRHVFHLGHGRTTNVFVLPNGHELLGKTLWLRAEEIGGTSRILNDRVTVRE